MNWRASITRVTYVSQEQKTFKKMQIKVNFEPNIITAKVYGRQKKFWPIIVSGTLNSLRGRES